MNLILKTIQFKTIESEVKFLTENGYTNEKGRPLKCIHCNGINLDSRNHQYMDTAGVCEYEVYCKECGKSIGHWAYGYWEV